MIAALLPIFATIGQKIASSVFPDPADQQKRDELAAKVQTEALQQSAAFERAAADIVKAEAQSGHWLAANWRPITALTFVALIVAHWLGWTAEGLTEPERLQLLEVVKIMIGGYVVSRGAEKVMDRYRR